MESAKTDKLDGEKYVYNTIDWLVKKDLEVLPHQQYSITSHHLFPTSLSSFKCEEILYVSDTCKESHYKRSHLKNKRM